jgi:hypothetical protein
MKGRLSYAWRSLALLVRALYQISLRGTFRRSTILCALIRCQPLSRFDRTSGLVPNAAKFEECESSQTKRDVQGKIATPPALFRFTRSTLRLLG